MKMYCYLLEETSHVSPKGGDHTLASILEEKVLLPLLGKATVTSHRKMYFYLSQEEVLLPLRGKLSITCESERYS